jgi:hypothetical protein
MTQVTPVRHADTPSQDSFIRPDPAVVTALREGSS